MASTRHASRSITKNTHSPVNASPLPAWAEDVLRDAPPFFDREGAARFLGISDRTVDRLINRGALIGIKITPGTQQSVVRIPRLSVAEYLVTNARGGR